MSPEQCRGEKNIGPKSDLYSMGVMFYELLTGRKPFVADSPVDMFLMHVNAEPVRAGKLVLSIPTWLDTLVDQLMAKKPEHRPLDAAMVAKALEEVEEKAIKQQSAGVDAVTARRVDRPGSSVEDADREAARALRSALTRKKIRKKSRRSNPEVWFRAAGLIALLLTIVGVIYFMTKPLPAEKYYELTKVAVDARDEDQVIKLTQRFVEIYPKADDAHAQQIRAWRKEFRAAQREKQLFNRFDKKIQAMDSDLQQDKDAWRLSANAFRYENDGDTDNARRVWLEMEESFQGAPDPEPAVYGWVAKKKSDDLAQLDSRAAALRAVLDEQRLGRRLDFKPESEPERLALTALRYQEFGDLPAARDRWAKIRDQYLKPIDVRPWGILAAQRAAQLKTAAVSGQDKEHNFRLELLARKWTQANAATMNSDPTEKRQAAGTCRDLIELYGKDPDPQIAAYGERAQQKLREIGGF
jgi:serine/threonine-protein kinase